MKKISMMLFLGVLVPLLFMQLSSAVEKTDQTDQSAKVEETQATSPNVQETQATSAKVEETSTEAALLGDKHKAAGVACTDCHKETPPASEVPTSVCMTCHEDYNQTASSSIDAHNAHVAFSNCGDCHHSHKASENQCQACHSFDLKVP
jgi:hypothetical protein